MDNGRSFDHTTLLYFTLVQTANSPRLLYSSVSGELVGGEVVSWWRVG